MTSRFRVSDGLPKPPIPSLTCARTHAYKHQFLETKRNPKPPRHCGSRRRPVSVALPPFAIVVGDGFSLRTIHPAGLGAHRAGIEAALSAVLVLAEKPHSPASAAPHREPARTATMVQRETASGYSGDTCQSCGSFAMKRTGVCLTCEACGSTSGGCS